MAATRQDLTCALHMAVQQLDNQICDARELVFDLDDQLGNDPDVRLLMNVAIPAIEHVEDAARTAGIIRELARQAVIAAAA